MNLKAKMSPLKPIKTRISSLAPLKSKIKKMNVTFIFLTLTFCVICFLTEAQRLNNKTQHNSSRVTDF